jgi:two-component system phosphate regulon response regulator PhoB
VKAIQVIQYEQLILVLEDTEEILEIITIVLEEEGYMVKDASTISCFNAILSNVNPILFLLDVMFPDGNGLDVCNDLKKNPATSHLPVIIMTANTQIK